MLKARAIILASGVDWRRIAIDAIDRFLGNGVYYGAARSDAGLAQGKDIYLIGAGNSAGQAAIFFSGHARSVTLIVRGESLAKSMSQYLIEQIATKVEHAGRDAIGGRCRARRRTARGDRRRRPP